MKEHVSQYFETLKNAIDETSAFDAQGQPCLFEEAMDRAIRIIDEQTRAGHKLMFIGNGASASIASHMATDFWKNAGIKACAFNDASGLTCVGNDLGYKCVFQKPISIFANSGDVLIAISSSGCSENILLAVQTASAMGVKIITLSGFKEKNPLCQTGDINFYVPLSSYGHVEAIHHSICHCFVDSIIGKDAKKFVEEEVITKD